MINKWWKFQKDILNRFWVIQIQPNFIVHLGQPKGHFRQPEVPNAHLVVQGGQWNLVDFELLKSGLIYLFEFFTICSSHVCANLMKKILLLLNRPASNSPFLPKFWTALIVSFKQCGKCKMISHICRVQNIFIDNAFSMWFMNGSKGLWSQRC